MFPLSASERIIHQFENAKSNDEEMARWVPQREMKHDTRILLIDREAHDRKFLISAYFLMEMVKDARS